MGFVCLINPHEFVCNYFNPTTVNMPFPTYKQFDKMDCGPTCLRMIAKYYGKKFTSQYLRQQCGINRDGMSLLSLTEAATNLGFRTVPLKVTLEELKNENVLPAIAFWGQNHFVVLVKITKHKVHVADPGSGMLRYTHEQFLSNWVLPIDREKKRGVALLLEPTSKFYEEEGATTKQRHPFWRLGIYIVKHRKLFLQLMMIILVSSILQLFLPFFTKGVVDIGIATRDIQFVYALLIGQLMLFLGSTVVDFLRSWIMLHISARINISLLSEFLSKLIRLPISYFDTKMMGDIIQRINDHKRVEQFLTNSIVGTFFSIVSFVVLSFAVIYFNPLICLVYFGGSALYFGWIFSLMRYRKEIDYKQFALQASNQGALLQLLYGMQEIKLNDCEEQKRWQWERIQSGLFRLNIKSLTLMQVQQGVANLLNQTKNILVTILSAQFVIEGKMTLGEMMAVQFIIGQLNGPLQQFVQFVQATQDAKISLDRIDEIHHLTDEVTPDHLQADNAPVEDSSIRFENVSYKYPGYANNLVLKGINLTIPKGQTTAIVGMSGSGKTTLLKMLLKFYAPSAGEIRIGHVNLSTIHPRAWRAQCGTVLQDGYIFSDTIANNIALRDETPDLKRLLYAVKMANIYDFISSLPLGFNTKIGVEGNGISQGQRQRILIARAIYKDPDYIFLDEATNSLDSNNERLIQHNLETSFKGKTIVIVAHRLSTVRNADQILVMKKGEIVERGTHEELNRLKGDYFELVRNQLEVDA